MENFLFQLVWVGCSLDACLYATTLLSEIYIKTFSVIEIFFQGFNGDYYVDNSSLTSCMWCFCLSFVSEYTLLMTLCSLIRVVLGNLTSVFKDIFGTTVIIIYGGYKHVSQFHCLTLPQVHLHSKCQLAEIC